MTNQEISKHLLTINKSRQLYGIFIILNLLGVLLMFAQLDVFGSFICLIVVILLFNFTLA